MADYTILIVDYDPTEVDLAVAVLEQAGFTVETARNGVDGMEAFLRLEPDLTLIEMMLPRKSGLEVCRDLKLTNHGRQASVVVLGSKFRTRKYRHQALGSYRADDYLEKPLTEEILLELTERLFPDATPQQPAPAAREVTREPEPVAAGPRPDATRPVKTMESEIANRIDSVLDCLGGGPAPQANHPKPEQGS